MRRSRIVSFMGFGLAGRVVAAVTAAAVVAGVVAGVMTGVRARRGLGGLTGDVLGASVELATTAALVVAALALGTV